VTSFFGKRGRRAHEGIDLRAPDGTPVFAAKEGLVLYADTAIRGYGKLVVIRHEGKAATIYAHNSKLLVKRGQRIKQGQQIAFSGSTGHVTGPHLHFEIRQGLNAQNPIKYLPRLGRHKKQIAQNKASRNRSRRDLRVAAIK
jgi:lipoprotein NlpD